MDHYELKARLTAIQKQMPPQTKRAAAFSKINLEDLIESLILDCQQEDRDGWALSCLADAMRMLALGYFGRAAHQISCAVAPPTMRGRLVGWRLHEVEPLTIDGLLDDLKYLRELPVRMRRGEHSQNEAPPGNSLHVS